MSNFFKTIEEVRTGRRKPSYPEISRAITVYEDTENYTPSGFGYEYMIQIKFGTCVVAKDIKTLTEMKPATMRYMQELIFSEFRLPLLEIKQAVFNNNPLEVSKLVDEILETMFGVP
jgi:hypothetical protein